MKTLQAGLGIRVFVRALLVCILCAGVSGGKLRAASPVAPVTLAFDDFEGKQMSPLWQGGLPVAAIANSEPIIRPIYDVGLPRHTLTTLNQDTVLRMENLLDPLTRRGWSSVSTFKADNFRYEVRFNTLNQSPATGIDGLVEIWIIDAANPKRYDLVLPFGGNFSMSRCLFARSSIDDSYFNLGFNYKNNTYYRLVLEGGRDKKIRASVLSDEGVEIAGQTFNHDASAFASGFKIGLSQSMGAPGGPARASVAVDYARLTTTAPQLREVADVPRPARPVAPKAPLLPAPEPAPAVQNNVAPALASLTVTEHGRLEIFNAVELCWPTEAGRQYQLQWTSDTAKTAWTNFGEVVSGSGSNYCTFDSSRGQTQRFYRVLVIE